MYKVFFLTVLCLQSLLLFSAEKNLLKNGDFARYKVNWITDGEVKEEGKAGVLTLSGKAARAFSRQVIEIDPSDTFKITAEVTADKPVQVLIGLVPADKNWKEFYFRNTGAVPGTFAQLAEKTVKGSKKISLNKKIKVRRGNYLALGAREDLSDLPNYQLLRVASAAEVNGRTVVTLAQNLRKTLAAGSAVRVHTDGPTYLYTSNLRKGFPGKVQAAGFAGGKSKVRFSKGTAGFKVCLLIFPGRKAKDVKVQFRNIRVVRVSK